MADKIKEFFARKKGGKFKGKGHKLTEDTATKPVPVSQPVERVAPTNEAKQAGLAALARFEQKATMGLGKPSFGSKPKRVVSDSSGSSSSSGRGTVAASSKSAEQASPRPPAEMMAVVGVYFKCPLISDEVLPKEEWKEKLKQFLCENLAEAPKETSCLMIHSLNRDKEEVSQGVDTLVTYLENIVKNPTEEKYRKIRMGNKVFQEKVVKLQGAVEFLHASGFNKMSLPALKNPEELEDFLVYEGEVNKEELESMIDSLVNTEPIPIELDRNLQILTPDEALKKTELPDEFFRLTVEELKREQAARSERIEAMMQLRTKAMREKDEARETRKYRYTVIRIRMPDATLLQGTFGVYEKWKAVRTFVEDALQPPAPPFVLRTADSRILSDELDDTKLLDLKLVPAVILTFRTQTPKDNPSASLPPVAFKPELMVFVQPAT